MTVNTIHLCRPPVSGDTVYEPATKKQAVEDDKGIEGVAKAQALPVAGAILAKSDRQIARKQRSRDEEFADIEPGESVSEVRPSSRVSSCFETDAIIIAALEAPVSTKQVEVEMAKVKLKRKLIERENLENK